MNKSKETFKAITLYVVFLLIPVCVGLVLFAVGGQQVCGDRPAQLVFLLQCVTWSYPMLTILLGPIPAVLATVWFVRRIRMIRKQP